MKTSTESFIQSTEIQQSGKSSEMAKIEMWVNQAIAIGACTFTVNEKVSNESADNLRYLGYKVIQRVEPHNPNDRMSFDKHTTTISWE